jgi:hypothetical protein
MVRAAAYYFAPRHLQDAEFKPNPDKNIAILIDFVNPEQENQLFRRELHEEMKKVFDEHGVSKNVVPLETQMRLRQANRDFPRWSTQEVGRRLDAEQVISINIDSLTVRSDPDSPVLAPSVQVRVRVVASRAKTDAEARLWPKERDGRSVGPLTRPPVEMTGPDTADFVVGALGRDSGRQIATFFYQVDLEEGEEQEPVTR